MRAMRSVGQYEVLREIGRGGMAVVYLARQPDLDRFVALKELNAFHASDPSVAERFLRESRVTGSLSHANIVTVYDYLEHEGTPYIAMEYVARGSLRPYVGRLSLAQIAGVFEGLLAGLAHSEEHGIVHRDLKPENVMVTDDGQVKITDFGIAKATTKMQTGAFLTATGTTVGTPVYMAPEQAMAQDIGPWTDLYSVGCMAFELFAGHVPFHDSDAPMAILLRHVNEPIPPVSSIDPSVSPEISDWIGRLLVKDPPGRTQSAGQAWDEFEEIVIGLLGPRWRREARLNEPPPDAPEYAVPLTPAPFDAPETAAPPAPEPVVAEDESGFVTFGGWRETDEPVARAAPPAPPAPPPPATPLPLPVPIGPVAPRSGTRIPRAVPPRDAFVLAEPFSARLLPNFEYLHSPLVRDEGGVELLGNREIVDAVKERLMHSRGGSFLITGFRGVGKSTVVLRALKELSDESEDPLEYLPVVLSVARPMTVDQLLFEVVRRLFEALTDSGVLDTLEPDIRQALLLAYARTSMAFKETSSRARENAQSLSVDIGRLGAAGAAMSIVTPKLSVSRKRADSMAREASFLAYSHADVEHDFLRILGLLEMSAERPQRRRFVPRRRRPWRGRLVVVLDELDKLTSTPKGMKAVDKLLTGLKNLLTARNVHFVFVGGPELHDAFMRDVARGNSVYESVFACHLYVPCVWQAGGRLMSKLVDSPDPATAERLGGLVDYFEFKARGIPRLLLRELNGLVRWRGGEPEIVIDKLDATRVGFYAQIQQAVTEFVRTAVDEELLGMPIDEDRFRLGAYYATDWILRRGTAEFTVADILADDSKPNPLMNASPERVERLVGHLKAHRIVEKVWYQDGRHTMIGDASQANSYRLAPYVVGWLTSFARRNEVERAELGVVNGPGGARVDGTPAGAMPWETGGSIKRLKRGRYELGELVGVGGVGRVYRAYDRALDREVAVKLLAPHLLGDPTIRGRWLREAQIATQLKHDHIVRTFDVIEDEGNPALVMELVEGPSLRDVLPLKAPAAVAVTSQLLSALAFAQGVGLARFDLKPENVVFRDARRAVIVDLGLVKRIAPESGEFHTMAPTATRPVLLGTPAYMSPEQAIGAGVDIRSDVYCVGLVLYETIVGRHVRDLSGSPDDILAQAMAGTPVLDELAVSEELRAVLVRALASSPDARYGSPEEMRDALEGTPEGEASRLLDDAEVLLPRDAQPVGGRLAVMPSVRGAHG